ncbi:hypothetical protein J3459_007507 [Metarhizium acridum]|nr:hypothetical protein J3459_007507 [Metarhizium acridum]
MILEVHPEGLVAQKKILRCESATFNDVSRTWSGLISLRTVGIFVIEGGNSSLNSIASKFLFIFKSAPEAIHATSRLAEERPWRPPTRHICAHQTEEFK